MAQADDPEEIPVVSSTDLTAAFHTKGTWSLIISQERSDDALPYDEVGDGNLHFCFLHDGKTVCPDIEIHLDCDRLDGRPACPAGRTDSGFKSPYNHFGQVVIFYPKSRPQKPLLVVMAGGNWGGPGFPFGPLIWSYDHTADQFDERLAVNRSANTNGESRFILDGPLAGDVIADQASYRRHPRSYAYEIVLYRLLASGHYALALDYYGKSSWGDGNALDVIDAEMPEIERRLGLWKPGETLPPAQNLPPGCSVYLRNGLEWCKFAP
jgi:hypothetical protein